jgi:hypothetical protein
MNALTAIAATAYAIGLWMFAPRTIWDKEVATAKRNRQNRLTSTPEPEPTPKSELGAIAKPSEPTPEPIPATVPTPELTPQPEAPQQSIPDAIPETGEQSIPMPQKPVYIGWTTAQLREEAKTRKLNWRPLINGKRTPLKKPQLIELLTTQ